jgi:hypothetical protein
MVVPHWWYAMLQATPQGQHALCLFAAAQRQMLETIVCPLTVTDVAAAIDYE